MKRYIFNFNSNSNGAFPILSNGAFPILSNRSGQEVRILRQLTDSEGDIECQSMYKVKFDDGFIFYAFGYELEEI